MPMLKTADLEHMDTNEFTTRLHTTKAGECFTYAIGDYAFARERSRYNPEKFPEHSSWYAAFPYAGELQILHMLVWEGVNKKLITLKQRRLAPGKYEYIAEKLIEGKRKVH